MWERYRDELIAKLHRMRSLTDSAGECALIEAELHRVEAAMVAARQRRAIRYVPPSLFDAVRGGGL